MDKEILIRLEDIYIAIVNINNFLPEKRIFEEFCKDLKTKMAVERNVEIIGEAVSRILKKDTEISISNARKIVDTRNRISHGYDTVSDDIIWRIVINDLPVLKTEIEKLLSKNNI